MTEKPDKTGPRSAKVFHLPAERRPRSIEERVRQVESSIQNHFREQNDILREANEAMASRLERLTNGIETLVAEMHGVRTGKKEEAFARVAGLDCKPDLPTVSAEAALVYTLTASQIGEELGFHASQIGLLLGAKGLGWAGNGDYQEIGRTTKASAPKFWHFEVPRRLRAVLDQNQPELFNIKSKPVLAVFRKWAERS
ncbi:hypothetical protein ACO2Q0_18445 [Phenylobacterium sp. VNQ135]|uniref:hypothetical protein n=1 Tax=Phenylobacterium sp. VNQ135 TaxID=3400922 RepID=UPI003BFAC6EF